MKEKYLDYVLLTEEEYSRLIKEWGEFKVKKCIEKLDNFIPNSKAAKHYKDHNRVLRGWVNEWFQDKHPSYRKPENSNMQEIEVSDEAKEKTAELFRKLGKEKFGNNWKERVQQRNKAEETARNKQIEENYQKSLK